MAQNLKNLRKTAGVMSNSIIPDTDNAYDIGSAEDKIRDIYVDEGSLWVGDQTGVGSSGGKIKFKNRKATAPIRIETITSGAQRTFTAKLSGADAVNAQRFHDEFDGQMPGVTYEIENLAKTEKDTFALVSYTAEDTTTPGGPFPANAVLDPETTAGETIFAAHSTGDQYNIFMNMNAVTTSGPNGNLELGPNSRINFGPDNKMGVDSTGKIHSSNTKSSTSNTAGGIPIHNVSAGISVGTNRSFEAKLSTEDNQAFQDFGDELENGNVPVDTKYDIENQAGTEGGEFSIKSFVAEVAISISNIVQLDGSSAIKITTGVAHPFNTNNKKVYVTDIAGDATLASALNGNLYFAKKIDDTHIELYSDVDYANKVTSSAVYTSGGNLRTRAYAVMQADDQEAVNAFSNHSPGDRYKFFKEEKLVVTGRADGKLPLQFIEGPGGGTNFEDLFDPSTGGLHSSKIKIPVENEKIQASPGTPGEMVIGIVGGQWYLYVCVLPDTWGRTPLNIGW